LRAIPSYQAHGLILESDLKLPCRVAPDGDEPDVHLQAADIARFIRARGELPYTARGWFRFRRLADGSAYVGWNELFEFLVSRNGREILYHLHNRATLESFSVYMLGQVLSFSLISLGADPLHGTTVVVDGEAVVLLGDCGYGKSTLGAALLARGLKLVTDDLVVLEKTDVGWMVQPGVPRIKLFPAAARRLLGSEVSGTPMNRGTSKLILPLGARRVSSRPVPVKALYVLTPPERRRRVGRRHVQIESLDGRDAFLEVIRAAFNLLALESPRIASQFNFAKRLVNDVSIRRFTYPRDFSRLSTVCDALLADLGQRG
jgi:hypothetical protein